MRRGPISLFAVLATACAAGGGSATGSERPATPQTSLEVPETPAVTPPEDAMAPSRDAGAEAPKAASHPPDQTRVLRVTEVPDEMRIFDGPLAPEPCDFHRSYRGKIGETPLTVVLDPSGGQVHYDRPGAALSIVKRQVDAQRVRFEEKGGGKFEGTCNAKTGEITGSYALKGKTQSFELWPRPRDWPPMYRITRERRVAGNFPGCAKVAKPDTVTSVSLPGDDYGVAVCPPTSPKARREAISNGYAACAASESTLRVFGIKNATAVNRVLDHTSPFGVAAQDIKKCWSMHSFYSSTWVMHASADLLTVQIFRSEDWGGAHPMNSTGNGIAIDLASGKLVRLADLVTDTDVLRDLARSCAWDYLAVESIQKTGEVHAYPPRYPAECNEAPVSQLMWDCDPKDPNKLGPSWALMGEGIAILSQGHAHVSAALDGRGPVISWAALLRAGILDSKAPVARLWKGVSPAPPDAPACTSAYSGNPGLVRWTVVERGE